LVRCAWCRTRTAPARRSSTTSMGSWRGSSILGRRSLTWATPSPAPSSCCRRSAHVQPGRHDNPVRRRRSSPNRHSSRPRRNPCRDSAVEDLYLLVVIPAGTRQHRDDHGGCRRPVVADR
jgi:hypothetical protein